jgi:FkbM family methyltransferase
MGDMLKHQMQVFPVVELVSAPQTLAENLEITNNTTETSTCEDKNHEQIAPPPLFEPSPLIPIKLLQLLLLDSDVFINTAYLEILGRMPDPTGLNYFNQRLNAGISRIQILGQLAASGETALADKWYKKLRWSYLLLKYRRVPVLGWLIEFACAISRTHLNELLIHDDAKFIQHAFQSVLGHLPDQQSLIHYLTQLRNGRDKIAILSELRAVNENKETANRVAGLAAASWLHKLRHMPIFKWAIDTITLPSTTADNHQRLQAIALSVQQLNAQQQSDVARIYATLNEINIALKEGQHSALALAQKIDDNSRETKTLIGQEHTSLAYEIDKISKDAKTTLTKTQLGLTLIVQEATSQLIASIPQAAEDIKATILTPLLKAEKSQKLIRDQLGKLAHETATLIVQERSTLSHEISKIGHDVQEANSQLRASLPQAAEDIKATILIPILKAETSQNLLQEQLGKLALDVQTGLTKTHLDLARQIWESSERLNTALPQSIEEIKTAIVARLILGDRAQEQLRLQLGQHTVSISALISKESSIVSNDILSTLSNIQSDMTNRLQQAAEQLKTALPLVLKEDNTTILSKLAESLATQEQLRLQLAQNAASTATLISKSSATTSNDILSSLSSIQSDIANRVQQTTEQLKTALPLTLNENNTSILSKLAESLTAQEQLRLQLSQLNPQLGRIELYGLTAARRVAVPFGTEATMVRSSVGYVLCGNNDHALIAAIIESNELEPGTRKLIQRIIEPNDIFIDVGANIGMHTLAAAHAMHGQGKVIALEPYPPTVQLLEKTIWMNGYKNIVEIHSIAASDEQSERTLYLGATSGHHSLYPLDASSKTDSTPIKVSTTTIDQIMMNSPKANLIKIDAEGAELEVLAGAAMLINRNDNIAVIAEFGNSHLKRINVSTQAWLDNFQQFGFEFQAIHPDTGALRNISIDELDHIDSINLFFARPLSPIWAKAGGAS